MTNLLAVHLRVGLVFAALSLLGGCSGSSIAGQTGTGGMGTGGMGTGGTGTGGTGSGGTGSGGAGSGGTRASVSCRPAAPCPSGWLQYSDYSCSPPDPSGRSSCSSEGDGLCYLRCGTDADCQAVGLVSCGSIVFFNGSDAGHPVSVCNGTRQLPACSGDATGTGGQTTGSGGQGGSGSAATGGSNGSDGAGGVMVTGSGGSSMGGDTGSDGAAGAGTGGQAGAGGSGGHAGSGTSGADGGG